MARVRNPNRAKALELYREHGGDITNRAIAEALHEDEKVVAVWKSRDKWISVVQRSGQCCTTNKKGGQPGNKNATGPPENKNAEKHGLFSKYLPAETLDIINHMPKDPLDVLWDQIQIAYAAIMRAQQIMYVKDREDKTKEVVMDGAESTAYKVDQAWDKQANFLQAQARAMTSLNGMVKNYDDLLHKNWDMASEEQRARIENIKAGTAKVKSEVDRLNGDTKGNSLADAIKKMEDRRNGI